jgi:hypothetical protein
LQKYQDPLYSDSKIVQKEEQELHFVIRRVIVRDEKVKKVLCDLNEINCKVQIDRASLKDLNVQPAQLKKSQKYNQDGSNIESNRCVSCHLKCKL